MPPAMSTTTASYISIRDDAGLKSLSRNERAFTRDCALRKRSVRVDGRTAEQVRPVRLHLGRWDHGAECTVQWGNTRVTSLCTAELVRPSVDRPNEGQLVISVDLSPSASPSFRQAPPFTTGGAAAGGAGQPNYASQNQRLQANRILRCLEKIVLTGGTLDVEALCLIPRQWVWKFQLALTVLDDGGNPMDAAVMAAIASLRHYRKPHVDLEGGNNRDDNNNNNTTIAAAPILIPSHLKEPTPLPLHHTPLAISFAFIPLEDGSNLSTAANVAVSESNNNNMVGNAASSAGAVAALVDPTDREELLQNGSLTVGMNIHAEVCLLDYGGGCELPPTQLQECWKKAESCIRQLCTMLETSLEDADAQAQKDRLSKLVGQQQPPTTAADDAGTLDLPPLPSGTSPYFQQSDGSAMEIDNNDDNDQATTERVQTEAEEAYRQSALDFTQGHKAQKVREDDDHMRHSSQAFFNQSGNLLNSLLQSAKSASSTAGTDDPKQQSANSKDKESTGTATENKQTPSKQRKEKAKADAPVSSGQLDSDEEETTQLLQTEFQGDKSPGATKSASKSATKMDVDNDDDDIDDLAMAISSKKKKKKKTKK